MDARQGQSTQLIIAGLGVTALIDMAIEKIHQQLRRGYEDYSVVGQLIGKVLNSLYENEFELYPASDKNETSTDFLIAYKCQNLRPALFRACNAEISSVSDCAVLGAGQNVENQLHNLHNSAVGVSRGVLLAIRLLSAFRQTSVGRPGRIATLCLGDTGITEMTAWQIADVEQLLRQMGVRARTLLLDALDPNLSEDEFTKRLVEFQTAAIEVRTKHKRPIADRADAAGLGEPADRRGD